jgi:hypothetical protein
LRQLSFFTRRGYLVDLALTYRSQNNVRGFVAFVRGIVDRLARNRRVIDLQVTNEVNFAASPNTSDGAYGGAKDALIQGVIAASRQARRDHDPGLRIGFNWFYRTDPYSEQQFWGYLHDHGGPAFDRAVNWVGLDAYPGTFFPPAGVPSALPVNQTQAMINAFSVLRTCFMPEAGLGPRVAIHVSENGWPTGPGRSPRGAGGEPQRHGRSDNRLRRGLQRHAIQLVRPARLRLHRTRLRTALRAAIRQLHPEACLRRISKPDPPLQRRTAAQSRPPTS